MARLVAALTPVIVTVSFAIGIEPSFDEPSLTVVATRGETATLPCFIDFLGKFKVAWLLHLDSIPLTYEDRRVIDDTRFSIIRPSIREWNLQIREVGVDDEEPAAISLDDWRRDVMAIEGEDVMLTCNATGSPTPKISWYKKSNYLIGFGDQLVLRNVTRHDGDIYECVANNGVGKVARSWTKLTVEFGPRIFLPNRRIGQLIGRETILECTITASPQAVSYWQKDGRNLVNAVSAASAAASGAVSRSAVSIAGGTSVLLPPPLGGPGGLAAQLQQTKYRIEAYDEGDYTLTLSLRLQVTERADFGDYVCLASNARGSSHGVVHLYEYTGSDMKQPVMRRDDVGAQPQKPAAVSSTGVEPASGSKQAGEPKKLVSSKDYSRQQSHGQAAAITDRLKGRSEGHVTLSRWLPTTVCWIAVIIRECARLC